MAPISRRRGGRVAEGGGLLNRYRGSTSIVSSNLIPSAIRFERSFRGVTRAAPSETRDPATRLAVAAQRPMLLPGQKCRNVQGVVDAQEPPSRTHRCWATDTRNACAVDMADTCRTGGSYRPVRLHRVLRVIRTV